jgi:hypothetical protein
MKKNNTFTALIVFCSMILLASCATVHPNQALLPGTWKVTSIEKYVDPNAPVKTASETAAATAKQAPRVKPGDSTAKGGVSPALQEPPRTEDLIRRMIMVEERSSLIINPNGTAAKQYPGKVIKATWKMKKKGTRIVVKEMSTKQKWQFDILEISDKRAVLLRRSEYGDFKIVYVKQ